MSSLLVGFLVKLFDIPAAVIGLLGGWYARIWPHAIIAAFVGGSFGEIVLYLRQDAREFSVIIWLIGVAACFAWVVLARAIRRMLERAD